MNEEEQVDVNKSGQMGVSEQEWENGVGEQEKANESRQTRMREAKWEQMWGSNNSSRSNSQFSFSPLFKKKLI